MTLDPEDIFVTRDGLKIHALDWGGNGKPLLLLPPNGFCAGLFNPLAQQLRNNFRIISVDLRSQGQSDTPDDLTAGITFLEMAADVLSVLDSLGIEHCDALGESLGGGVAVIVDKLRPEIFRRLILSEAVAFDLESILKRSGSVPGSGDGGNFMATAARKRRAIWPDRQTVLSSYASRPPLNELDPESLAGYVRWGFVDRPDGQVELACPPEAEARLFEVSSGSAGATSAWRHLNSLHTPTTVWYGSRSNLPIEWFLGQAARIGCTAREVDGGHFFLQEDTNQSATLVREYLAE